MSMFSDYETAINDFGGLGSEHMESLLEDSLACGTPTPRKGRTGFPPSI